MKYSRLLGNLHIFSSFRTHLTRVFRGNFITKSNPFKVIAGYKWQIPYETIVIIAEQVIGQLTGKNQIQDNYGAFRSYYRSIDDGRLIQKFKESLIIDLGNFINSSGILGETNTTVIASKIKTFLATNTNYKCLPLTNVFINLSLNYVKIDDTHVSSNMLMSKVTTIIQSFASQFTIQLIGVTDFKEIIADHNKAYKNSVFLGYEAGDITWDNFPIQLGLVNALVKYCDLDYSEISINNTLPAVGDFFEIHVQEVTIDKKGDVISIDNDYLEQFTLPSDGVDLFTVALNKAFCIRPSELPSLEEEDYKDQYTSEDIDTHNEFYTIIEFTKKYLPMIYSKNVKSFKGKFRNTKIFDTLTSNSNKSSEKRIQSVYYTVDTIIEKKIIASLFSGIEITNYGLPSVNGGGSGNSGPKGPNPSNPGGGSSSPSTDRGDINPETSPSNPSDSGGSSGSSEPNQTQSESSQSTETSDTISSFPLLDHQIENSLLEVANLGEASAEEIVTARHLISSGLKQAGVSTMRNVALPVLVAVLKNKLVGSDGLVTIRNNITNKLADDVNLSVNPTLGLNLRK